MRLHKITGAYFAVFILLVCSLQAASAISTSMKETYEPGETIIAEVYGNILEPIKPENVIFKRGHVAIALEYGINKLGERTFIWAISPEAGNNYTLEIKNIATSVLGKAQTISYEKNFSVAGNITDYSIKPGIVYANADFKIVAQLNRDENIAIKVDFPYERDVGLKPGANTISFSIKNINETKLFNISIGKYIVPAYVISNKTEAYNYGNLTINNTGGEEENLTAGHNETIDNGGEEITEDSAMHYCVEYNGNICGANEACSGETKITKDGSCCINGKCSAKGEGGSLSWIGYVLAALVIILGVYIWVRYKKVKAEKNPLKKIIEKSSAPKI
jgi:hypothetical protein